MPRLFEPLTIKDITLRNRIGISPMCQYSYQDGFSNDWQLVHLGARASGGAGLIIVEATAVEARGRITPNDLGLWDDRQVEPLSRVTRFLKEYGSVPGIQIAHAGRKACTIRPWDGGRPVPVGNTDFWPVVGASPLAFAEGYQVPAELTVAEIRLIQQHFAEAAVRALSAGFEWLELHAAHGYLLHSFLSPLSNQRTDQYGGSFENRIRMVLETVAALQTVWPERLPMTIRISGSDWVEGGWDIEQSVELAKALKIAGVDLVDCSSGGNVAKAAVPLGPGYQVPIADAVRNRAGIPTAAVGLITEARQAETILQQGQADLILLGRASLRNPNWPIDAAHELGQAAPVPPQYLRAY